MDTFAKVGDSICKVQTAESSISRSRTNFLSQSIDYCTYMNGARSRYRSRYELVEWTPKDSRGKRVWSVSSSLFLRSSTVCMLLEGYADYDGGGILDNRIKASSFILAHSARRLVCRCEI